MSTWVNLKEYINQHVLPVPTEAGQVLTSNAASAGAFSWVSRDFKCWLWLLGPYGSENQGVKYCLLNGTCYISADLGGDSAKNITSSGVTVGTLPTGYRPAYNTYASACGKGNNTGQIEVTPSGAVTLWLFGGSSVYYAGFISYPV